jgi:uncharacterized membrane protein YphA (DoxX/SURF4 family)
MLSLIKPLMKMTLTGCRSLEGIPLFVALFPGGTEFFGGLFLMIGFLSTFWSIALTIAMIVAIVTVEIHEIIP